MPTWRKVDCSSLQFMLRGNHKPWTQKHVWNMNVVDVLCRQLPHIDNTMFEVVQTAQEINTGRGSNICPHHLPPYKNFPALHVSYLDFSWGWLVSSVYLYFLLSSSRFISFLKIKVVQDSGATACLSWVAAWEWMVMRHRLRSQRDSQILMGLQAEATSREEAWCQQQRLALGSVLAS